MDKLPCIHLPCCFVNKYYFYSVKIPFNWRLLPHYSDAVQTISLLRLVSTLDVLPILGSLRKIVRHKLRVQVENRRKQCRQLGINPLSSDQFGGEADDEADHCHAAVECFGKLCEAALRRVQRCLLCKASLFKVPEGLVLRLDALVNVDLHGHRRGDGRAARRGAERDVTAGLEKEESAVDLTDGVKELTKAIFSGVLINVFSCETKSERNG